MIVAHDLDLVFGQQVIFNKISFTANKNQKIGLVGRNGAGKSTMLKVISGMQALDGGTVSIERDKKIAYLPQDVVLLSSRSVLEEAFAVFDDVFALKKEHDELEAYFAQHATDADPAKVERYGHIVQEYAGIDIGSLEVKTKMVLQGLGLGPERWVMSVDQLSVGWKMRLVLAKLLLQDADFYLFDEPTNHLDIVAKDWFLDFLKNARFGFMLVSHDRYFLDHVCDYIFEVERGKGTMYVGNYSKYLELKEQAAAQVEKAYLMQQKEIKTKMELVNRFRASANRASFAQSLLKQIEKMELVEIPPKPPEVKVSFTPVVRSGEIVLSVSNVSKGFGHNKLFKDVNFEIVRGEKVALVAANGVGKTTLLSIVMDKCSADTGAIKYGHNVTPAFFEQDQERSLNREKTILEEVEDNCKTSEARSRVRAFLGTFLFPGDDVYKRIAVLSGGEKNRVAMVKVLLQGSNFLILDEPTNHLDLQSKEVLLHALQQYQGTLLFVSHDRDFLNALATRIIELAPAGARSYKGNYDSFIYCKQEQTPGAAVQQQSVAKPTAQKAVASPAGGGKEAYEARKKRNNLERKVEKLEAEVAQLNATLVTLEWGSDEHARLAERIKQLQKSHREAYAEWERLG